MKNNEIKVKLNTPEEIIDFVGMVLKFYADVDIIDGSKVIDAKSLVGVCALAKGKEVVVRILSNDFEAVEEFKWVLRRFEVK